MILSVQAISPAQVAAGSIASAVTILAQSAVSGGVDETTGWAAGVIVAGIAVFRFMDRRQQKVLNDHADMRRRDDEENQERIKHLEARLSAEQQAHVLTVKELTDQIIAMVKRELEGQ